MAFDRDFERTVVLGDGTRLLVRSVRPGDKEALVEGFTRLSEQSRYRRFLSPTDRLSDAQLVYLTEIDYQDHFAIAAMLADEPGMPGVGIARYVRLPADPSAAEAAVAVVDDMHHRGIGTILLRALGEAAVAHGIKRFRGFGLSENRAIVRVLRSLGAHIRMQGPEFSFDLELPSEDLVASPLYQALRAAAQSGVPPFHHPWSRHGAGVPRS